MSTRSHIAANHSLPPAGSLRKPEIPQAVLHSSPVAFIGMNIVDPLRNTGDGNWPVLSITDLHSKPKSSILARRYYGIGFRDSVTRQLGFVYTDLRPKYYSIKVFHLPQSSSKQNESSWGKELCHDSLPRQESSGRQKGVIASW